MPDSNMSSIAEIRHLEAELEEKQRSVAASLKTERTKRDLSLRQVARKVRIVPSGLLAIERGKSWRTDTVARIARFYERADQVESKTARRA